MALNGGLSVYCALSADEIYNTVSNTTYNQFVSNTIVTNLGALNSAFWSSAYGNIYHANACIEGLTGSTKVTEPLKKQLLGESLFMRALNYFYLVNLFGDVPLILTTDYRITEGQARTPTQEVYKQIMGDLQEAKILLVPSYPTSGQVRANKWAATALLARVNLYLKNWADAESLSTEIINSGSYAVLPVLNSVFLADSKEAILQLIPPASTLNTSEGYTFIPSSATVLPPFTVTNSLYNSFEAADKRRTSWLAKNTVSSKEYFYPAKYKIKTNTIKTEYNMVLRYTEQYLIRAEARAWQNKLYGINGSEGDVNVIRTRAGLSGVVVSDQASMLLSIEKENQLEFFAEFAHRWLDLKRTGRIDAVLSGTKPDWKNFNALYPVPFLEIQRNPALNQNPGYQ
ncbi:RagB/SusD family nutrient uptake outer membrane protein [Pedobacter sp.]